MCYCLCAKVCREIRFLSITSTLPSDTASTSCQVNGKEVPSSAGAHTSTLHDPLIHSPRYKIKLSLPLHVVFETSSSNQWSLTKLNLLLTHQGEEIYSDNHLLGPSPHLVKAMPKVVGSKLG